MRCGPVRATDIIVTDIPVSGATTQGTLQGPRKVVPGRYGSYPGAQGKPGFVAEALRPGRRGRVHRRAVCEWQGGGWPVGGTHHARDRSTLRAAAPSW